MPSQDSTAKFSFPIKPLAGAIAIASAIGWSDTAIASDAATPSTDIETIVVTAVRTGADEKQVARPLAVVSKEKIQQQQPASTAEVVSHETNVEATGGPRAGSQLVNIRGLEGHQVLQTVDGVRQNYESGHRPTYFIDPVLLRNVEVLKGPASSLWGSGAIGGVVAQNTINASDILKPDQNIGGLVKYGYNDNGEASNTTIAVGARTDTLDLLASGYYRDGNDIELGHKGSNLTDTLEGSGARNQGGMLKGLWQITDGQSLGLNFRQSELHGSVPTNSSAPISSTSNWLTQRDTRDENISLDYRIKTDSPWVNAQALVYRNETQMNESRVSDNRSDRINLKTHGWAFNNQSEFAGISLLYGIDGYRDDFSAEYEGSNRPIPPEAKVSVNGQFVQATIPLINNVLRTELGLRHDKFRTEAENLNTSRTESAISPSAALVWQADTWLEMAMRYDEAFRAPSSEEMYTTGTHFCMLPGFCNRFVSNPNLDPETAANKELLVKMQWSNVFAADDTLHVKASAFRNDVDNFIEQIVTPPTFFPVMDPGYTTWVNVDKARLTGFELDMRYQWNNWDTRIGYGQTRGKDRETHEALTNIPADKWVLDTNYTFVPEQKLLAGVRLTQASAQDRLPQSTTNEYDSYTITDIYASWQPAGENLTLDLSINNITDEYYRVAFQELYQPGREVRVSATYRF
jgi:hemoglobin/transferrin/lactoferrin receptor protein